MKIKKLKYFIFILFPFIFITNCSSDNRIDEETIAKIYVDNLIIEEQYQNKDSVNIKKEEILKKYSVKKADYGNAIKSFKYDKEKWDNFFALSKAYLDTLKTKLDKKDLQKNKLEK